MKKKKDIFDDASKAAIGLGTIGLATGVGASIATKAGVTGLGGSFSTLTGFTGIATTAYMGKSVLNMTKKLGGKKNGNSKNWNKES